MGNYNPRQNTRMKWRDAREIEKYVFISAEFNFQNEEVIQNASQDKLYFKIVNEIIKCSKNVKSEPLIIFDEYNGNIYVGYVSDDSTAYATYTASNANSILEFEYHGDTDVLNIQLHDEVYVTADNIKTIFGQDITGTGDITMYRHQLTLHATDGEYTTCFLNIYSSNNLKVDSLQDLTTLLKPNANTLYTGLSTVTIGMPNLLLKYENNIWQIGDVGDVGFNLNPVTSVEDVVTPI